MMNYQASFTLSSEQFDPHGNLLPSHVLWLAQRAADEHAYDLGVGFESMLAKKLLWVITQVRYQVCDALRPGETVTVKTWPLPPTKLGFERNFLVCDAQGKVCIQGMSNWVMIDTEERRFVTPQNLYPSEEYCMEKVFPDRAKRLRDFEADSEAYACCPDESTIDYNGHVNNTFYPGFVLDSLGDFGGVIRAFQIDYIHEVMCRQPLTLYHKKQDDKILVKGLIDGETRSFTCTITI